MRERRRTARSRLGALLPSLALAFVIAPSLHAQAPLRKIGELELRLAGVAAGIEPAHPVVPRNIASAVRVVVRAGGVELGAAEVARFVGGDFEVQGELSGPGLGSTLSLPQAGEARPADPLLLMLPALSNAGDYALSNLRIVAEGRVALDVEPRNATVQVIDQVLVTSVKTRALTLDEIREKGIVLDSDAYLGFEFTLGLKLESTPVNFSFPVVFDRQGVAVPQALLPPPPPPRGSLVALPTIVPMLLEAEGPPGPGGVRPKFPLSTPSGQPIRIPSVLVIPGNVGYLKQFFSAQLFVANGAPVGSGLSVRDVSGTIRLPPGDDAEGGTPDDPLALPDTVRGPQPETLPVRGLGADGEPGTGDDRVALQPGEQGQAEFLIRGDREGFHSIAFDISAELDGLPVGPVTITGKASGGVLVRNPYFDVTFTAPAVVRKGEDFKLYATVTNIGQGLANDLSLSLDASRLSGARLVGAASLGIDTLRPGDAATLAFDLRGERTGQVVASYLRFDTQDGSTGDLRFTLGVGERGVPLSPDTLVLPSSVESLPGGVVDAALRVLGQAWSVANAPAGTLPSGVIRASRTVVGQKALALAEAGLRVGLGQPQPDAVRDLLFDFYGPAPVDPGFDQLLRETEAGRDFAAILGAALEDAALSSGGATGLERDASEVAAAGPDFLAFAVDAGAGVTLALRDASGTETASGAPAGIPSSVLVPLSASGRRALGLVAAPTSSPYALELGAAGGSARVSLTLPRGDGRFARYVLPALPDGSRVTIDLSRPDRLTVRQGPGPATTDVTPTESLESGGPRLLSATVIGPETLAGAGPFGQHAALLFDRVVDAASAADVSRYEIADNAVRGARRQLSGRLVFAALESPEGPYVPAELSAGGLRDPRGAVGPPLSVSLGSRLEEPGAVVSGRVVNADGTPVTAGNVTYTNNVDAYCEQPVVSGISTQALGADGQYELRYVRRDPCGQPFGVVTQDPTTGAVRGASTYVRRAGERLVLDVVLLGRGSVEGTVRDLQGQPVANADVVVLSNVDSQSGAATRTDGDGRYRVTGITVGAVTVKAAKGLYVGQSGGRLDRAGSSTSVDVVLNTGSVDVSGTVRKLEDGTTSPVAGVQVLYSEGGTLVGVTESGPDGAFAFADMPAGAFTIRAALNTRDSASLTGVAAAGDILTGRDLLIVISPDAEYGTVAGTVRSAGGEPAGGVIVSVAERGVLSAADGSYVVPGVAVRAGVLQAVEARTRDGLRRGSASFVMNAPATVTRDVALSGVGSAEFTVLDVAGQPLAGIDVGLLGACSDACGCQYAKSGADGKVRFDGLPLGTATAQAIRLGSFLDAVRGSASLLADGGVGSAVLRFAGTGAVSGVVLGPDGRPSFGADVVLRSNRFVNDGGGVCGLVAGESHRIRTDTEGRFRIPRVNLGAVSLSVSQPFFPTQVGAQGVLQQDGQELAFTVRLVDTISGELSGTVFLPDGATPAGAGVEVTATGPLPDVTVSTNALGRFRFARIFPEGSYTVTARDPVTGGVVQERLYLRAGQDTGRNLRLKGRGAVRVRVVDGAGVPVDSAFVTVTESEFPWRRYEEALQASSGGLVEFPSVFEGPFGVEVKDVLGRGGRASSVLTGPGAAQEVTVRLSASGSVRGHFYKRDNVTAIPFGIVTLRVAGRVVGQIATQGAGDVGAFAFDHVPAGGFELLAQDPISARTASYVGTIANEGDLVDVRLVAQGVGTVQGRVLQNGEPRGAASVALTSGSFSVTTATDGQGRYVVAGVPEGRVSVTASLAGAQAGTAAGNLVGEGQSLTLDVTLRSTGSIVGRVLRADGVTPGPISVVRMGLQASAATDAEGRYRFDQVPVGRVDLAADDLTGIDYARASGAVAEGQETTIDLRLNGVASAAVSVRDAHGQPVSGASVWLRSKSIAYGDEPSILGVADAEGIALFPEIAAGRLSVSARNPASGLEGVAQGPIVGDGGSASLDVTLEGAGRVTAQVLQSDGTPAPGAKLLAWLPSGLRVVFADADGRASFENVKAGAFTVDAETEAGDVGHGAGSVVVDATTHVEVRLGGLGTVRVSVQDPSGSGVAGVKVWANNREGVTGPDGAVALVGVRAGSFEVRAWDPARVSGATTNATLAPGGDVAVTLTLLPAGRLRGRVVEPDGVTAVVGAQVVSGGRLAFTDAAGAFELVNLPVSGSQRADAVVDGRTRAVASFTLSAGSPDLDGLELVLVGLGRVTGVVTGPDGAPVPSLKVRLQHPSNLWGGTFEATTDAAGAYLLGGIPVGAVTLSAQDAAGNRADGAAQITEHGQTVQVDLTLLSSAVSLPLDLYDANGFRFLVGADGTTPGQQVIHGIGTVQGPRLSVVRGGETFVFGGSGALAASALDRREVVVRQEAAGLRLERRLYVPLDGYFGRYLDVVTNTGSEPVLLDVVEDLALRPPDGASAAVVSTSSGDDELDAADRHVVLDDPAAGDFYTDQTWPPVAVVAGGGASAPLFSAQDAALGYRWSGLTVAPGERVALLHFFSFQGDRGRATASALRLEQLPPEALVGLTPEDAAAIVNFAVPTDLRSALEPLPGNDGLVAGRVVAGDRATTVPGVAVTLKSRSPYYGRPIEVGVDAGAAFVLRPSQGYDGLHVVPRTDFDLSTAYSWGGFPVQSATAAGAFAASGTVDLTSLPGRTLRYSTSADPANVGRAVDRDEGSRFGWRLGDLASPGAGTPFFEIAYPTDVTVGRVRLVGADFLRARIEVRDAQAQVAWSEERDLSSGGLDIAVPDVGGRAVRLVNVVDGNPYAGSFADLEISGDSRGVPSGRVEQDVAFAGTGVVTGRLRRADGQPYAGASMALRSGSTSVTRDGRVSLPDYRFLVVPVGDYVIEGYLPSAGPPQPAAVSQAVGVAADQLTALDLTFPATGRLVAELHNADASPATALLTLVGPIERSASATGTHTFADLLPGSYTLTATRHPVTLTAIAEISADADSTVAFTFPPFGRVAATVTAGGQPLANAGVTWRQGPSGDVRSSCTTDASGQCTLEGVTGTDVRVRATYPGSTVIRAEQAVAVTVEDQTLAVAIDLPRPGSVSGVVYAATGAPLPSASVSIRLEDGTLVTQRTADAAGAFSISPVPAGPVLVQASRASFLTPTEVPAIVGADATTAVAIQLVGALRSNGDRDVSRVAVPAGTALSVSVSSASDAALGPLGDGKLEVYDPTGALLGSGPSVVIPAGAGGLHTLVVRAGTDPTGAYQINLPSVYGVQRPTGRVTGQVLLRDGSPAAGVRLRVTSGPFVRHATTDSTGAFAVDGVPAGSSSVEALDAEGVVLGSVAADVAEPGEATATLSVSPRTTVTASVTRSGQAVSGLDVRFESDDAAAPETDRIRMRTTDAGGRATVVLPAGLVTARVTDPLTGGTFEQTGTADAGGSLDLGLVLPDIPAVVRGRVTLVGGSEPAAGALVSLSGVGTAAADANGDYRFDGVPTGPRTLTASLGATSTSVPVAVGAGADHVVNLTLPGAVLRGVVSEPAGVIAGATVEACGANNSFFSTACVTTTTSTDGSYLIAGLPSWRKCNGTSGCYPVNVQVTARVSDGSGLSASASFSYDYTIPAIHAVSLTLPATGSVTGVVRDSAGQPSPEADVYLDSRHVVADATGAFRFPRVRPATVRVYAERAGDRIPGLSDYGDVAADAELALDVTLSPVGTIHGTLVDENGQPLADRQVAVAAQNAPTPTANWSRVVTTAADGTVSFPAPVGPYRVVFGGDADAAVCRNDGPSAAEGELGLGAVEAVALQRGSHAIEGILGGALGAYGSEETCAGTQTASDRLATAPSWLQGSYASVVALEVEGRAYRTLREIGFGVEVRKQEYVPPSGAFARTLTLLTNRTDQPIDVELPSDLALPPPGGEDCTGPEGPGWLLAETSSGDATFDAQDSFAIVLPSEAGANAYGVVFGDAVSPTTAEFWEGRLSYGSEGCGSGQDGSLLATHVIALPPFATKALLTFTVSRVVDDATLSDQVHALADLSDPDALTGLTAEDRAAIVNFVLPGETRLQGRIEDAGGNPSPGARVAIVAAGDVADETVADAAGNYAFPSVAAGDYRVVAIAPDNRPGASDVGVLAGQTNEAVIRLLADDEVGLVLVHADPPDAAEGVGVTLSVEGYSPAWTAAGSFDATGLAVLGNVPSGHVLVEAGDPFVGASVEGDHAAPVTTELTLPLVGPTRVTGVVLDGFGAPAAAARVALFRGGEAWTEGETDSEGRFELSPGEAGDYRLEAFDPASGRPGSLPIALADGQTLDVVVTLLDDAQLGTLRVTGVGAVDGLPIPGLPVTLEAPSSLWTASAVLDALGQATVVHVPPGRVGIRIDGPSPQVGYAVANAVAQQQVDVLIPIGAQQAFPIDLTGADLQAYFARSASVVEATGDGDDWACTPFCTGWSEFAVDGAAVLYSEWPAAQVSQAGREAGIGPELEGGLRIARRVFVPESGRFVRVLDVIENTDAQAHTVSYYVEQAQQSLVGAWDVVATSSGDAVFDAGDAFAVLADPDPASPALAWVHANPSAAAVVHLDTNRVQEQPWTWLYDEGELVLQPGQKAVLLRFAVQRPHGDIDGARTQAEALADLSDPEALLGLSPDERSAIVNFVVNP